MYILATSNQGKLKEFKELFNKMGLEIQSYNLEGIEENGSTFEENALIKAKTVAKVTNLPTIADDSGLSIRCLDNFPGIHSARVFRELNNYDEKCKKMIELVNEKNTNRDAFFTCVICIYYPKTDKYHIFKGETFGEILNELKGNNGHGYDPIFYSHELKKSFAQATMEEKNLISHRAKAFEKLKQFLKDNKDV